MKLVFSFLVLISFSAQAMPHMTVKERLRLHLWVYGLDQDERVTEKKHQKSFQRQKRELPEELERALRKI